MAFSNNVDPSRVGVINGTTDGSFAQDNALFLKVFSGEILTTFEEFNVMKDLHTVRTIQNGKTAQFPATGTATASYHTAGESLIETDNEYLSDIKKNEITINIDDVLISSTFLANIDELKTHYDVRSIYASELGKALAKRFDIAVMKTLVAGARQDATITGNSGGTQITGATLTNATGLIDALYEVAQKLDEKDVPSEDRFAVLKPAQYYKLITSDNVAVSNAGAFGGTSSIVGGFNVKSPFEGATATGVVPMVAGIKIFKSNHIPSTNLASTTTGDGASNNDVFDVNHSGSGNGSGYNGNFSSTGFIAGHKAAVGTVKLLDLATESEYQIERQGTLFVAKYAMGHGVIRPECCVEVQ